MLGIDLFVRVNIFVDGSDVSVEASLREEHIFELLGINLGALADQVQPIISVGA